MPKSFPTNSRQLENNTPSPKGQRGKPHCVVRHHSITVPIYAGFNRGRTRYTLTFYRNGKRQRRCFTDLSEARKEAKVVAEKILRGMQGDNDLKPAEREAFLAAQRILADTGVPLVVAAEDYAECRKLLGGVPLRSAVEDFLRRTRGAKLGVTVPQLAGELIAVKEQDGMSAHYLSQLRSVLGIKQKAVPRKSAALAKDLGLSWPQNVLRHSFISYRLATIQDANQVALDAGNSPAIIFKHYRELVTEEAATTWFAIKPPDGWTPPEEKRQRRRTSPIT